MSSCRETGDAPGEAFDETVVELVDYLAAVDAQVCCARRVSHLMTRDRQQLTIAGVAVLAHEQFEEARQIYRLIPTAASAFNGELRRVFAPPRPHWPATQRDLTRSSSGQAPDTPSTGYGRAEAGLVRPTWRSGSAAAPPASPSA